MKTLRISCRFAAVPEISSNMVRELCPRRNAMKSFRPRLTQALLLLFAVSATVPAHAQAFSVLYNFGTSTGDPATPYFSSVIAQGRDGKLYSTTDFGGDNG